MSNLTLYNKYRPLLFENVIGQSHIVKSVKSFMKKGKVPHAILLSGIRGTGKTTLARLIARRINCEEPDFAEPCNKCSNCKSFLEGNHPDIFEFDAASNTGIDDVRNIQEKAYVQAQFGKNRIFIIDEVHNMSGKAIDAFLKMIEEPPPNLYFIFATTDIYKLKPTFRSRCQPFKLWRVKPREIAQRLELISKEEKVEYDVDALKEIGRLAEGSVRDAISSYELVSNIGITMENVYDAIGGLNPSTVFGLFDNLARGDNDKFVVGIDEILERGTDPMPLLNEVVSHLLRIYQIQIGAAGIKQKVPSFFIQKYNQYATVFTWDILEAIIKLKKCFPVYTVNDAILTLMVLLQHITGEETVVKTTTPSIAPAASLSKKVEKKQSQQKVSPAEFRNYAHWLCKKFNGEIINDSPDLVTIGVMGKNLDCLLDKCNKVNDYYIMYDTIVDLYKSGNVVGFSFQDLVQSGEIDYEKA